MKSIVLILFTILFMESCSKNNLTPKLKDLKTVLEYNQNSLTIDDTKSILLKANFPITDISPTNLDNPSLYSFKTSNLPIGLYIDQNSGLIAGTPTAIGEYNTIITATLKSKTNVIKIFSNKIKVIEEIVPSNLLYNTTYTQQANEIIHIEKNSVVGNFLNFTQIGLPSSLNINPATGEISGMYTGTGEDLTVSISATNDLGSTSTNTTIIFPCINNSYTKINHVCIPKNQSRICQNQPINSYNGTELSTDGGLTWSNCSNFTCTIGHSLNGNQCVLTNNSRACVIQPSNSNSGAEITNDGGLTWGTCSGYLCNPNYTNINGVCLQTNQSRTCLAQPTHSSGGFESSTNGGVSWGSCSNFTCDATYTNVGGVCLQTNQSRTCLTQPNNSTGGTESSTNGGVSWGSCSGFNCNPTFINVGGSCIIANRSRACLTQPNNSTGGTESSTNGGVSWGQCSNYTCDANYTNINGICTLTNQTRACLTQPSHSSGGIETSTDAGVTWGICSNFTCDATYTNLNGICTLTNQTRACLTQPSHSSGGLESSTNGGVSWGSCSNFTCDANYTNISGVCTLTNQTRSCLTQPNHSSGGVETSTDAGLTWGLCSSFNCDVNYININGICTLTNQSRSCLTQPSHSSGGVETSTDGGVSWGQCSNFNCDATYTNVNGICTLTNQSRSCLTQPSNSTGGTESSTDAGLTWGQCSNFNCDPTYTNVNGVCKLTNQSRACLTQPNHSSGGIESSTNGGVSWGSCTSFTCDANYTNISGVCTLTNQSRACLTQPMYSSGGTESSTNAGVTWNSCTGFSCDANYINVSGVCTVTNQSRACLTQPTHSTGGTESSTDGGVTWGPCSSFTCDATYTNLNGICTLTNQSRACLTQPINSTGGTESSTNAGITWNSCTGFSCDATYTNVSGVCTVTNQSRACLTQPTHSTGGTESSTDAGLTWGQCSNFLCDATYTNVGGVCTLTNQSRACLTQPTHSTGGIESSTNGGATWGQCSNFTCDTGYSNNGNSCSINSYSITVNKLINQATVNDITLGLMSSAVTDTSVSQSYVYGQMIVFEATPSQGYSITGWTGCDSVSADFLRCTISSISSDRIITPTIQASYLTLSFNWENATIASLATSYSISKNGSACSGACLSSIILTDNISVSVTPGSSLNNASSWNLTGNYSNLVTTTTNTATFKMGSVNVSITPILIDVAPTISDNYALDLEEVAAPHNQVQSLGSKDIANKHQYIYFSNTNSIRFYITSSGLTNSREISFYPNNNCSGTSSWNTLSSNYGPLSITNNGTTNYSFKTRNVTQESSCNIVTLYQESTITQSSETVVLNTSVEGSSGFNSFFKDASNTISGICSFQSIVGNQYLYNYGKTENSIIATVTAFHNSDLVNPYYTTTTSGSCSGSSLYSLSLASDSNFSTADVINVSLTFKDYFNAQLTLNITPTIVTTTRSCLITHGTGSQSYVSNGSYTACSISTCDATYINVNNACVLQNQTRACVSQPANSTGGTESTTNGGVSWGSCSGFTCSASYQLSTNGNQCESIIIPHMKNYTTDTDNACAINSSGAVYCWGWNGFGQLGDGTQNDSTIPVAVSTSGVLSGKTILQVSMGDSHACAVASDNKVYCWGSNGNGQLGNNSLVDSTIPVAVSTAGVLSGKTIVSVASGNNFSCVLTIGGSVHCWGLNSSGQLGNSSTTQSKIPVSVTTSGLLNGKTVLQLVAGGAHACVIASDYKAYCWGFNASGQLGNNSTGSLTTPSAVYTTGVLSGKTLRQISTTNDDSVCVITNDNLSYCWGNGGDGQLGNNTWVNSKIPVAVSMTGVLSGETIKSINTGFHHTCALTNSNKIACWGRGANGQLGDGLANASATPVLVDQSVHLSGKTIVDITTGWYESCAKTSDNKMYCWGWNNSAQFGLLNDWSQYNSPIQAVPNFGF